MFSTWIPRFKAAVRCKKLVKIKNPKLRIIFLFIRSVYMSRSSAAKLIQRAFRKFSM